MSEEDLRFRSFKDAKKFVKKHRIGKDRFITVHGKKMKVKTIKSQKTSKNWTKKLNLESGDLTSLGYHTKDVRATRHKALGRAIKKYGYVPVMRKINVLANLNVNRPKLHKIFRNDVEWLKTRS